MVYAILFSFADKEAVCVNLFGLLMRLFGCGFVTLSARSRWLCPSKVPHLAQKSVIPFSKN
jgi:hypothetical protein